MSAETNIASIEGTKYYSQQCLRTGPGFNTTIKDLSKINGNSLGGTWTNQSWCAVWTWQLWLISQQRIKIEKLLTFTGDCLPSSAAEDEVPSAFGLPFAGPGWVSSSFRILSSIASRRNPNASTSGLLELRIVAASSSSTSNSISNSASTIASSFRSKSCANPTHQQISIRHFYPYKSSGISSFTSKDSKYIWRTQNQE